MFKKATDILTSIGILALFIYFLIVAPFSFIFGGIFGALCIIVASER